MNSHSASVTRRRGMIVAPDRVVYSGLLGVPSSRMFGAHIVYIAHENPFDIRIGAGATQRRQLAVVPAGEEHEIHSQDRLIRDILIEPESVSCEAILQLERDVMTQTSVAYPQLQGAFDAWLAGRDLSSAATAELDSFFFAKLLPLPTVDARIQRVVQRIRACPNLQFSANECARLTGLSFSRFVHLFKEEIGMTFRAFCAWKRARSVLPAMVGPCNLTQLALDAGYPDSSHFSHSIRRIFGLCPRDILAGSQRLALHPESVRA